ncbi:MAG TPA: heavy metal sensor histidine kinase [Azospira sp.]|nr:heavy metal sensor histidine kinase [Azospira sp.]
MNLRRPSLTLRLTALFAATAAVALLALGQVIALAMDRHFQEQDRAELQAKLDLTASALRRTSDSAGLDRLPQFLDDALVGHHGLSILITNGDGRLLFATSSANSAFPRPPDDILSSPGAGQQSPLFTWEQNGQSWRGLSARLLSGDPTAKPLHVLVALDIGHHRQFLAAFHRTLWLAVLLAIAAIALLGWIAVRQGLKPLQFMTQVARTVSADALGQRLDLSAIPIELTELGQAFNAMLNRLEDAFQRLTHFSADIAHELRTPVSNLMTQTEVALSQPRSVDEYREVLYSNLEEYGRLARMIGDMLFLAKADNGLVVPKQETVNLGHEVQALLEFYEAVAEEKGISLEASGSATVSGDRLMLRRALSNLLSNAIAHGASKQPIKIRIEVTGNESRTSVSNQGPPISPDAQSRIFDRFYRADPARSHDTAKGGEGAGLGLAIVRSIARAHGGDVEVLSGSDGTEFTLVLPMAFPDH